MVERIELALVGKSSQSERLLTILERGSQDVTVNLTISGADKLTELASKGLDIKIQGLDELGKLVTELKGLNIKLGSAGGGVTKTTPPPTQRSSLLANARLVAQQTRRGAVDPELSGVVQDLQKAAAGTGDLAIRARDLLAKVDKAKAGFDQAVAKANQQVKGGAGEIFTNRIANLFGRGRQESALVEEIKAKAASRFGLASSVAGTLAEPAERGLLGTLKAGGGAIKGALAGEAAAVGGEIGALGGPIGIAVGVAGGLVLDKALEGVSESLHAFTEQLEGAVEAGREFQESIQSVAAGLQINTRVVGEGGRELSPTEAVEFNQRQASRIQKEARRSLTPLGITGNAEAQLVSRILTGASSRGFLLDSKQTTNIARNLGAAAQVLTPGLLGSQRGGQDLEDIILGSPTAGRTQLGVSLKSTGVLAAFRSAKSSEELSRASDLLAKFVEAVTNSNLAIQSETRIRGALSAAQSEFGAAFLEGIGPGLKEIATALEQANLSESFAELGKAVGEAVGAFGPLVAELTSLTASLIKGGAGAVREGRTRIGGALEDQKSAFAGLFKGDLGAISRAGPLGLISSLVAPGAGAAAVKQRDAQLDEKARAEASPRNLIKGVLTQIGQSPEEFEKRVQELRLPTIGTQISRLDALLTDKRIAGTPEAREQEPALRSLRAELRREQQGELLRGVAFGSQANVATAATKVGFARENQADLEQRLGRVRDEQFALTQDALKQGSLSEDQLSRAAELREQNIRLEQELAEASAATVRSIDEQVASIESLSQLREQAVQGIGPERDLAAAGVRRAGVAEQVAAKDSQIAELEKLSRQATEERKPIIQKELEVRQLERAALQQRDTQLLVEEEILRRRVALRDVDQGTIAGRLQGTRADIEDQVSRGQITRRVADIQLTRAGRGAELEKAGAQLSVEQATNTYKNTIASLADRSKDLAQSFKEATRAIDDFANNAELSQLQGEERIAAIDDQLRQGVTVGDVTLGGGGLGAGLAESNEQRAARKLRILQIQREQAVKDVNRATEDNSLFGDNKDRLIRQRDAIQREQGALPLQAKEATLGYLNAINSATTALGTDFSSSVSLATDTLNKLAESLGVVIKTITPSGVPVPSTTPKPQTPPQAASEGSSGTGTVPSAPQPTAQAGNGDALNRLVAQLPGILTTAVQQGFQNSFPGA